jgi:hypothetical protein
VGSRVESQSFEGNPERLIDELVRRVMGWQVAPGRFIKAGRCWIPRRRFQPLANLDHAFQLLDASRGTYSVAGTGSGAFLAQVRIGNSTGSASGEPKATAITIATARALGLYPLSSPTATHSGREGGARS